MLIRISIKKEPTMKAKFQHHLNVLHVYCRLRAIVGKRAAKAIARYWENTIFYKHFIYSLV